MFHCFQITAAYNNAKSHSLWTHQYSMETEEEYWAVGTEAWFNTIHTTYATGGMNVYVFVIVIFMECYLPARTILVRIIYEPRHEISNNVAF